MRTRSSRFTALLMALVFAAAAALTAVAPALAAPQVAPALADEAERPLGAELARVRAATARFHDVAVAEAAGYVEMSPCVARPDGAAMGHHWVRVDLIDDVLDPTQPEALLYAPSPSGDLRLVGVEYLSTDEDATLFGQHFHPGPMAPGLHVWLWQANPDGMFAEFNPNVGC